VNSWIQITPNEALDNQEKMIDERPKLEQAKMAKSNIHNAI